MNPLKNLILNLQATGPAAAVCVWFITMACVGVFGQGDNASRALGFIGMGGAVVLGALMTSGR